MSLITAAILKQICPKVHTDRSFTLATLINDICPKYGMNTKDIFHEFFANLVHECNQFTDYEENLNYSAQALTIKFPKRISVEDAFRYGRTDKHQANHKEIANRIYGGKWGKENLGNIFPDDGFTFRGSGPIQNTGRANITKFGDWMDKTFAIRKTPEDWAQLLRTSDEFGIHSACWFFAIAKKLIDEAEADYMKEIVKRINGGYNGLNDRERIYELCKKLIV